MRRTTALMILSVAFELTIGLNPRAAFTQQQSKPNIIFVLADDQGIDGVGCYGSDRFKGKTPNIDRLAADGIHFTHCYSNPLCGPSRATLMTGRYCFRHGGNANNNAWNVLPKNEVGIAKVLKQAGYATCQVGKFRQVGGPLEAWGFDESLTDPDFSGWYWRDNYIKDGRQVKLPEPIYVPDVAHDFAIDFIRRHKDQPFFLYYASHLLHTPIVRTPDTAAGVTDNERIYEDNAAYLDKQVGMLMAELDALKLRERTLVLYCGDNGCARQPSTIHGRKINGNKGKLVEGGSRVPLIANWKGVAPAGRVSDDLIDFTDMFTTFAELGEAKLPRGVIIDGHSFAPQLRGQTGTPRQLVFVQLNRNWYVCDHEFKLTKRGDLFGLSDAPFVEKPIPADAQDAGVEAARRRLQGVLDQLSPATGKSLPEIREAKTKAKRKRAKTTVP